MGTRINCQYGVNRMTSIVLGRRIPRDGKREGDRDIVFKERGKGPPSVIEIRFVKGLAD